MTEIYILLGIAIILQIVLIFLLRQDDGMVDVEVFQWGDSVEDMIFMSNCKVHIMWHDKRKEASK